MDNEAYYRQIWGDIRDAICRIADSIEDEQEPCEFANVLARCRDLELKCKD